MARFGTPNSTRSSDSPSASATPPARSPERRRRAITEGLWSKQTLVKAVRDGGVHATTDEAFVVPGPRIVEVAETMAAWFHGVRLR